MKRSLPVLLILVLLGNSSAWAQIDPHFSSYYIYPSYINPALTGVFDGDYRISGIYRNQWANVGSAFSTPGVSIDVATEKSINYGINVMNQTAGAFNTINGGISLAYTGLRFGTNGNQRISFGANAGFINRRVNPNKMTFPDQNPGGGTGQTAEVINQKSATAFDIAFGAMYYDAEPGKKANIFVGVSGSHLSRPQNKFLTNSMSDDRIPVRWTAHGGVRLLFDNFSLTPNVLYMRQSKSEEVMLGAYAQLRANETTDLMFGANYRFNDAAVPFVGLYFKNMIVGLSYDINTSDLGKVAKGASSVEISLTYIGRKRTSTPAEPFVCPRL